MFVGAPAIPAIVGLIFLLQFVTNSHFLRLEGATVVTMLEATLDPVRARGS